MVPYYPNARPAQKLTYCFKNIYTQSILLAYGLLYFLGNRRQAGFKELNHDLSQLRKDLNHVENRYGQPTQEGAGRYDSYGYPSN
jgi:hypothetical protein